MAALKLVHHVPTETSYFARFFIREFYKIMQICCVVQSEFCSKFSIKKTLRQQNSKFTLLKNSSLSRYTYAKISHVSSIAEINSSSEKLYTSFEILAERRRRR